MDPSNLKAGILYSYDGDGPYVYDGPESGEMHRFVHSDGSAVSLSEWYVWRNITYWHEPLGYQQECCEEPTARQVGGDHYQLPIQPVEYIHRNGLDYFEGNAVKYITRHRKKGGKADLLKAIHYLEMLIEYEYPES